MLATCRQHVTNLSKCHQIWLKMRVRANTKMAPAQDFCVRIADTTIHHPQPQPFCSAAPQFSYHTHPSCHCCCKHITAALAGLASVRRVVEQRRQNSSSSSSCAQLLLLPGCHHPCPCPCPLIPFLLPLLLPLLSLLLLLLPSMLLLSSPLPRDGIVPQGRHHPCVLDCPCPSPPLPESALTIVVDNDCHHLRQ